MGQALGSEAGVDQDTQTPQALAPSFAQGLGSESGVDQDTLSPGSCLCQRLCDGAQKEGGNPSGANPAGVLTRVSGERAQLPGRGFPD